MPKTLSWYLVKLDRLAAWALLGTVLAYIISGFGMTKGIIDGSLAADLHNRWLPLILFLTFGYHSCFAVSLAFKRWRIWNKYTRTLLITSYLIALLALIYLSNFYQKSSVTENPKTNTKAAKETTTPITAQTEPVTDQATDSVYTASELAQYNGLNSTASYVAISGKVYDVSSLFINGTHRGCQAGQDVTAEFNRFHTAIILRTFKTVGTYSG